MAVVSTHVISAVWTNGQERLGQRHRRHQGLCGRQFGQGKTRHRPGQKRPRQTRRHPRSRRNPEARRPCHRRVHNLRKVHITHGQRSRLRRFLHLRTLRQVPANINTFALCIYLTVALFALSLFAGRFQLLGFRLDCRRFRFRPFYDGNGIIRLGRIWFRRSA